MSPGGVPQPPPLTNPALILSVHHRRRRVAGEGRLVVAPLCPRYASNISCIYTDRTRRAAKGASHLHAGKIKYSEHIHVRQ